MAEGLAGFIGGAGATMVADGAVAVLVGSFWGGGLGNAAGQAATNMVTTGSPSVDVQQACVQGLWSAIATFGGGPFAAAGSTPLRAGVFQVANSSLGQTLLNMVTPIKLGGFETFSAPRPAPPPPSPSPSPSPPIAEGSSDQEIIDGGYKPYDAALDMRGP